MSIKEKLFWNCVVQPILTGIIVYIFLSITK